MSAVTIPRAVLAAVLAHAAGDADREVCGLLIGGDEGITGAMPTRNVAPDAARFFEVEPQALFAALRVERTGGPRLLGHYHSHPNGSTAPSPRDAAAAEPGRLWLIVAGGGARLWCAMEGGFQPVTLLPS